MVHRETETAFDLLHGRSTCESEEMTENGEALAAIQHGDKGLFNSAVASKA